MGAITLQREALNQFMRRTHREHMTVRIASIVLIGAGWIAAAGAGDVGLALAWMALSVIAEWRILVRVRSFEACLDAGSPDVEDRIIRELTLLTGVLTAVFSAPAALLAMRGGVASLAGVIIACGVLLNISAQHVLHRRMIFVSLPLPVIALLLAAVTLGGPRHEAVAIAFAVTLTMHAYTINRAAVHSYESLIRARIRAEEAGLAKTQFLANMSHELRTPLNAIVGYSELMAESAADEGRDTDVRDHTRVLSAANRLKQLINEVLDLSKVEAGAMTLEHATFDARACLEDALDVVRTSATANGNTLRAVISPAVGLMEGDAFRLGQCVLNLLSNAAKFTANGEIVLRADVVDAPDGAARLVIAIQDTGIGMNEAQLAALFQPFRQADSTITRRFGGTGLGLALTRRLAVLMGGDLTVTSAPGAGSCFTLSVRLGMDRTGARRSGAEETRIQVRNMHFDFPAPEPGSAAASMDRAFHLALSAVFPEGEKFFVQSVRALEAVAQGALAQQVRSFVRQELIHSREHLAFNRLHEHAGSPLERMSRRALDQLSVVRRRSAVSQLATTVSLEHFTAVFAMHLLKEPAHLAYATSMERDLWRWHAVEEIEHKSVAFDLYCLATQRWPAPLRWAHRALSYVDATARLLVVVWANVGDVARTGPETQAGWRRRLIAHVFVRPGVVGAMAPDLLRFFAPGFHPEQIDDARWLASARGVLPDRVAAAH